MTAYELLELSFTQQSLVSSNITVYLTLVSGYLVAAFLVGKKLTSNQALVVSAMFVIAASFQIIMAAFRVDSAVRFGREACE